MRKKILSFILTLCMVLTLMPTMAVRVQAEEPVAHTDHCICGASHSAIGDHTDGNKYTSTWQEWNVIDSLPSSAGYYYLKEDVTINSEWSPANNTVLCLNGHIITGTGSGNMIKVESNCTFTLTDCTKTGKILRDIYTSDSLHIAGGTFKMYEGSIEHAESAYGVGVFISTDSSSQFNMYGGQIANNKRSSGSGAGVYNNTTFNMYGGVVSGNEVPAGEDGGGVYNKGTFNMSGGTITNNNAKNGGGVYNNTAGTFTMSGGSISQHKTSYGGGVYNEGTFTVSGGQITNNTSSFDGGGVYNKGTFNMSGNQITDNHAMFGGGVYNKGTFNMSGGQITDNTSSHGGGVSNEGTFTMDGGNISKNTGTNSGGVRNVGNVTMNYGNISENSSTMCGGVENGGTFNMKGGSITNSTFPA